MVVLVHGILLIIKAVKALVRSSHVETTVEKEKESKVAVLSMPQQVTFISIFHFLYVEKGIDE